MDLDPWTATDSAKRNCPCCGAIEARDSPTTSGDRLYMCGTTVKADGTVVQSSWCEYREWEREEKTRLVAE